MRIVEVKVLPEHRIEITTDEGAVGVFDVSPYLGCEVFLPFRGEEVFRKISNGGYSIEWDSSADLSADTIEAHMSICRDPQNVKQA